MSISLIGTLVLVGKTPRPAHRESITEPLGPIRSYAPDPRRFR
jgi:hypothetical protein